MNAGASFGNAKTDFNGAPIIFVVTPITPDLLGVGPDISHPSGFIGGGQIGYNWQYSPLIVVGIEADIQGALEKETNTLGHDFSSFANCITPGCTSLGSYTTEIDWFGTVRARIGYLWGDGAVLTYLTGGLAYGEVKINGTNNAGGFFQIVGGPIEPFSATQAFSQSHVNTGWVVGSVWRASC